MTEARRVTQEKADSLDTTVRLVMTGLLAFLELPERWDLEVFLAKEASLDYQDPPASLEVKAQQVLKATQDRLVPPVLRDRRDHPVQSALPVPKVFWVLLEQLVLEVNLACLVFLELMACPDLPVILERLVLRVTLAVPDLRYELKRSSTATILIASNWNWHRRVLSASLVFVVLKETKVFAVHWARKATKVTKELTARKETLVKRENAVRKDCKVPLV